MDKKTILIVDDEPNIREVLRGMLEAQNYHVLEDANGRDAVETLASERIHTVLADLKMPKMDGLALLEHVKEHHPAVPVIIITAHGTVHTAVEAMKKGAFDYITKPFDNTTLLLTLKKAINTESFYSKEFSCSESFRQKALAVIGKSREIRKIIDEIPAIANDLSSVLITGETGTGKELFAHLIHEKSSRRRAPFIKLNCAAIEPDLIEKELFGTPTKQLNEYSSGKPGAFELALKGTLFLDEIAALQSSLQDKLLKILQQNEFTGVDQQPIRINFRLVCATNLNLFKEVEDGRFSKELFYRLNRTTIYLPPLRERMGDIELLADHFREVYAEKYAKKVKYISDEAVATLIGYPWPGNIRELEGVMESTVQLCPSNKIRREDLPDAILNDPRTYATGPIHSLKKIVEEKTKEAEKAAILETLKKCEGDLLRASQELGVHPDQLQQKIYIYNISLTATVSDESTSN